MPSANHVSNITVTVLLQALAAPGAGFGIVTHFVDEALGNGLNGARYIEYSDADGALDDEAAGYIDATTLKAVQTAFLQPKPPTAFRVVRVDTAGAETLTTARTAYLALGLNDVYCYTAYTRVQADQKTFADLIEAADNEIYIFQDNDADWKTSGLPAAWAAGTSYATMTQVAGVYHDVTTEFADVAAACRWLAWDPDETSAPSEGQLGGVADYSSYVIDSVRTLMQANNIAVLGTYGSTDYWLDALNSGDGRPFYERLTADWFEARVSEEIQTMHQRETLNGRKILVDVLGMAQLESAVKKITDQGERARHFTPGQVVITPETITDADRTARRLRLTVEAQIGISTRLFNITANFSTTPVVA